MCPGARGAGTRLSGLGCFYRHVACSPDGMGRVPLFFVAVCCSVACSEPRPEQPAITDELPRAKPAVAVEPEPDETAWPGARARLNPPQVTLPARGRKWRVYLDAGHGAANNSGNSSAFCEAEEVFTLRVAEELKRGLEATGRFVVRLSRKGDQKTAYKRRVTEAEAWPADVFLSLHSDARGWGLKWDPVPGRFCYRQDKTPGFSILWSDDAKSRLRTRRHQLARAFATRMTETGFLAYDGVDYEGLYQGDETPGVFVDRHRPGGRIYVLRRPKVPSVIIETHHAWDVREATRWKESATLEAFAQATAAALSDFLSAPKK